MTNREITAIVAALAGVYIAFQFAPTPLSPVDPPDSGDAGGASLLDGLASAVGLGGSMQLSSQGAADIQRYEGQNGQPVLTGYPDSAGIPTDGWGNTKGAVIGQTITLAKAQTDFDFNVQDAVNAVNGAVTVPLSQGEFDVLVSFAFNVGTTAFRRSTLLAVLNSGDYSSVPAQLMRWTNAGGKYSQGLANRRGFESAAWNLAQAAAPRLSRRRP